MSQRLRPAKWTLTQKCTKRCSVNPANIGDDKYKLVHGWYEQGLNDHKIAQNAFHADLDLSPAALGRHRANHMLQAGETPMVPGDAAVKKKLTDLEALDAILEQGASQIEQWRITPSDWFKALDAKYKLTQGSAFEDMLEALAIAEDDDEEDFEGVDEDEPGPGVLREAPPEQRPPSGSGEVAEELQGTD